MKTSSKVAGGVASLALAASFIGGWEGLRTTSYQDIVGVWTVCYGETKGVTKGQTYTKEQCDEKLGQEIVYYETELDKCLKVSVPIKTKIALVSWTYNVGPGAACSSTLVRKANAGDIEGACNELPRWNKAGGRIIGGLTNRRVAERELCLSGLE